MWESHPRLYFTALSIGTPEEKFYLGVDTGRNDFFLNCISCERCPRKNNNGVCIPVLANNSLVLLPLNRMGLFSCKIICDIFRNSCPITFIKELWMWVCDMRSSLVVSSACSGQTLIPMLSICTCVDHFPWEFFVAHSRWSSSYMIRQCHKVQVQLCALTSSVWPPTAAAFHLGAIPTPSACITTVSLSMTR